ncbi:MAG: hypothetical protein ABJG15_16770 [Hyphomonadaceae bacterium]
MFKKIFGGKKKRSENGIFALAKENRPAPEQSNAVPRSADPGQAALLRHLDEKDKEDPIARLEIAGRAVFDLACQSLKGLGGREGIRVEDLLALLGSAGGYSTIVTVLAQIEADANSIEKVGMQHVGTADGRHFYFGDFLNHVLLNHEKAILRMSLGMSKHLGGTASVDDVTDAMAYTASKVGTPEFGIPRLPEDHRPIVSPTEFVRLIWPRINQELERYEISVILRPSVIGFAIMNAMQAGKDTIDPTLATKIIIECAVPTSRLDPAEMEHPNP